MRVLVALTFLCGAQGAAQAIDPGIGGVGGRGGPMVASLGQAHYERDVESPLASLDW